MKLLSLQIFPNGSTGWSSELLRFGDNITQLFGPNGCGKTPLVQSIPFCLGYPSVFRNDIYERCNHAILTIETAKGTLSLKRTYSREVDIEVTDPDGDVNRFFDEKMFSEYIFNWLDLNPKNLVANNNRVTSPYISTLLPIYYLDQDNGYSAFYCPPANFIKDQFSEMIRLIFGLPVKNSFDAKKDKIEAKEYLDYLDREVEAHARRLKLAKQNTPTMSNSSEELETEIQKLSEELEQLSLSGSSKSDSINALDQLISGHRASLIDVNQEINEASKRSNGIDRIIHEINTEIETLNLNEEARRVFLSFNEICSSADCQLFSSSSESYSKNLLYLKDQIKDLERNTNTDRARLTFLHNQKDHLEKLILETVGKRNSSHEESGISTFVVAVSEIKDQVFALQNQLSELRKVEALGAKYLEVTIKRRTALEKYQSFTSERLHSPALVKLKADLRQYFLNWLDEIHTSNISRDITFKDDFTPILGKERIAQLKGSTRIRAVLAYHAALLELTAKHASQGFNFLILDTPKQHEIHNEDLDRYMLGLKKMCVKYELQIIFSTTEYYYAGDDKDVHWIPKFPGEEQNMFLRSS